MLSYSIEYSHYFNYRPVLPWSAGGNDFPALIVNLKRNKKELTVAALIDTVSEFSLFSAQLGSELGLDIREGPFRRLISLGGPINGYLHRIEIAIEGGWSLGEIAVLFAEADLPRNILGRTDFLTAVDVGISEKYQRIYVKKPET